MAARRSQKTEYRMGLVATLGPVVIAPMAARDEDADKAEDARDARLLRTARRQLDAGTLPTTSLEELKAKLGL